MVLLSISDKSRETALALAATLLAYARSDIGEIADGTDLAERLEDGLYDLVHEFCYHSRKAVERARGVSKHPTIGQLRVHERPTAALISREGSTCRVPLTDESFEWIVNRIVHSLDFEVVTTAEGIETHRDGVVVTSLDVGGPRLIGFRSDRDQDRTMHYVELESLVLTFARRIAPLLGPGA